MINGEYLKRELQKLIARLNDGTVYHELEIRELECDLAEEIKELISKAEALPYKVHK